MSKAQSLGFHHSGDRIACPVCRYELRHDGGGRTWDHWWCSRCGREYDSTSLKVQQPTLFEEERDR